MTVLPSQVRAAEVSARPMGRLIDREIRRKLADEILFGELMNGGGVTVDADLEKDELFFEVDARKKPSDSSSNRRQHESVG